MKKTLAAVAVLGAFAGSALAADVTLYGKVDLGLEYSHVSSDVAGDSDSFKMTNGGSRFGFNIRSAELTVVAVEIYGLPPMIVREITPSSLAPSNAIMGLRPNNAFASTTN